MRPRHWTLLSTAALLLPGIALAQGMPDSDDMLGQPFGVRPAAMSRDAGYDGLEAAPVPGGPLPGQAPPSLDSQAYPSIPVAVPDPIPPAGWKLPQPQLFQHLGIVWGGWTQAGATSNAWNPPSHFNGPVATNDRNEFQMNQFWLYFDRPTKTEGHGWDWGGHIDLCYGTDWRFGKNFGLEDRINSPDNLYGLVIPQFYASAAVNDLTVKMGHMATAFGYESVPSPMNFFYSHSYAMSYTEPLLVTGVVAEYQLTPETVLVGGFHRGWMMFEDQNSSLDVLAGVRWTSEDNARKLSFMIDSGPQVVPWMPAGEENDHNRFAYSLVWQENLTEKLVYVLQHNLGVENGTSLAAPGTQAEWYGINQYFFYQYNPEWRFGVRAEWLRDEDGTRVAGVGNWIGSDSGWRGAPGFAGDFWNITLGANWRPCPNFVLRPEVRWDWYGGSRNLANQLPFNDGANASQFTAAMDAVVTY